MKALIDYFTDDAIISQLCKMRIKIASNRSKKHRSHLLTSSSRYNYHNEELNFQSGPEIKLNQFEEYNIELIKNLNELLPPRKKWVKLGERIRYISENQLLPTSDKNYLSLIKTIKVYQNRDVKEEWVVRLESFILKIKKCILDDKYEIESPIIYPKPKNSKTIGLVECRPIAIYGLIDRIILSVANKFLTRLFDGYFLDSSFAFRWKRDVLTNRKLSHHDCINEILKIREMNASGALYVVECDIEKFYDSLDHKIVLNLFGKLIGRAAADHPEVDFGQITQIFRSYLFSYSFNRNVPKQDQAEYWKSYGIDDGVFVWVEDRLKVLCYYDNINDQRIGVPQGGSLSGLIANIVLNEADLEMSKLNACYYRFCDDMIILHQDIEECNLAKKTFESELKKLRLISHPFIYENNEKIYFGASFETVRDQLKLFWNSKSKGPFKWSRVESNGFPWIGFVGYEIKFSGEIRIRKTSFLKEINKQKIIVKKTKRIVFSGPRKSKNAFLESSIQKMIGMSVGKITLRNYQTLYNGKCWKQGFRSLTNNYYSRSQIRHLDRSRNKCYQSIVNWLREIEWPEIKVQKSKTRQIVKYNKPFSYYYQVLERAPKF